MCSACVGYLADQVVRHPTITPILAVHDLAAADEFWTRAGLDIEQYSPEYALVRVNGAIVMHLASAPNSTPTPTTTMLPATSTSMTRLRGRSDGRHTGFRCRRFRPNPGA